MEFNINSNDDLSILFFGGRKSIEEKEPELDDNGNIKLYKTGQHKGSVRLRTVKRQVKIKGLVTPVKEWAVAKEGFYSTNEEVLVVIKEKSIGDASEIASLLLEIRGLQKQIATYYDSTEAVIYESDNAVHASFIHVQTDTSRSSCKNPNLQNQPDSSDSRVKQHFVTRYADKGLLVGADYSQIEPTIQAQVSNDPNLLQDINDGLDSHCKKLAFKEGLPYDEVYQKCKVEEIPEWKEKRRLAKEFSFQRSYGATAFSIAKSTGLPIREVEDLEKADRNMYPDLFRYNLNNQRLVEKQGYYSGITGRRYCFTKLPKAWDYKEYGMACWFSPTKVKNYIIQGTAADVMFIQLGRFWREYALYDRNKYLMINTVHDSLMLDCQVQYAEYAKKILTECLTNTDFICYNYGVRFNVPLKIDITEGQSWYEL
jgi:DNA polymerase-1